MSRALKVLALVVAFVAVYTLSRHLIGSTPTSTTIATTTTSSSTTSTTIASASCDPSGFSGVFNEGEGAAGTIYASVTLTKSSTGTCTLEGWPLMTLQDKLGAVLPLTLVDVPSSSTGFTFFTPQANEPPKSLTLSANSVVTFALAYSDVATGTAACESAVTINVQFARDQPSIDITPTYAIQPCNDGQVWVSPFYVAS